MDRREELKLIEDVSYLRGQIDSLDCKVGKPCPNKWSVQQKAVAGTGLCSSIAAIILVIIDKLSSGVR